MKPVAILALVAILGTALAVPQWLAVPNYQVEELHAFSFKIGLKPQNLEHLDSLFWQISDPKSPLFGKFLTNDQIKDLISLPEADIKQVEDYLQESADQVCEVLTRRSVHDDYIFVDTCAGQANLIFPNLQLSVFEKEEAKHVILRSAIEMDVAENLTLLGLPQRLHQHVAGIHGVTDMPVHMFHSGTDTDQSPLPAWETDAKEFTTESMIEYFGIHYDGLEQSALTADNGQVRQGVIEFDNAAFSATELASFQKKFNAPSNPIQKIIGSEETFGGPGTEASLDVQTITAISGTIQTWDFVFSATVDFIDIVDTLMKTAGAPNVLSCSWESYENSYTQSKANASSEAFMKLGLAGTTFFIDAGDAGPSLGPGCKNFDPQFPGTSPYVTAVGGTKVSKTTGVESAWIHSSGGFSNLMKRPAYQDEKVQYYLDHAELPPNPNGRYVTTGRAFPDISAIGAYEPVFANGSYQPVGGTSGSTPQFAAITAIINVHRYQKGLGPLGAMNQVFWTLKDGVGHDVVEGQNYATNRSGTCGNTYFPGFKAFKGWDPVTGVGSPRFDTLYNQLIDLKGN